MRTGKAPGLQDALRVVCALTVLVAASSHVGRGGHEDRCTVHVRLRVRLRGLRGLRALPAAGRARSQGRPY